MSELNSNLRNSSHLSASFLKTWECSLLHCLQNEDGVENTLGTINYTSTLFCMKTSFILKAVSLSLPWQARQCVLQNVKKLREFKHLKEATVNWLPYLILQTCFMTCKRLQFSWNDCSVWAEVNVKEQLSLGVRTGGCSPPPPIFLKINQFGQKWSCHSGKIILPGWLENRVW